jgi:glycosyltransferase involved in cell wall biosynthesis
MNILLINHYAGSPEMGMEFRPYYFAKKWNEQGHNTIILAADNSHIRKHNPVVDKDFEEQTIDGIKYVWVKTRKYEGNGMSRFMNMLDFIKKTYTNAKFLVNKYKPDIVIASSTYPLDNYVAHKIAKLAKTKFIYELHDLWPLSPMELGGMSKYNPFIMLMQAGENFAYRHCGATVSILPKTKEHCIEHGLKPEKWFHIPNGIYLDDWNKTQPIPDEYQSKFKEIKRAGKKIIGYAGGHAISNALDTFIQAAILLKDDRRFHFVLVGNGNEKEKLIEMSKKTNNVDFLDTLPKNSVPELLKNFDILYIGWNHSPLYRYGISPNKIFDYMMSAKPIIHAVDAANDILKDAKAGISIEPENPKLLVETILSLSNLPNEKLLEMGQNGRNFVLKNHTYKILADKFLKIIEGIKK